MLQSLIVVVLAVVVTAMVTPHDMRLRVLGLTMAAIVAAPFVALLLNYGTASPCEALSREMRRDMAQDMPISGLGFAIVSTAQLALDRQIEALGPAKCAGILWKKKTER